MNTKIKCLIVDDEQATHYILTDYIKYIDKLELTGQCYNGLEAMNFLHKNSVNLIFLDINMPRLSGFDFLKTLTNPPAVILVTAHSSYGLESYEYNVVDYLLKPVEFPRFLKAIDNFFTTTHIKSVPDESLMQPGEQFLPVRVSGRTVNIHFDEIIYTQSLGNYIKLVTPNKNYTCAMTTTEMEKHLVQKNFVRIHKSYIANVAKIEKLTDSALLINGTELPVSITYRRKLKEKLSESNLL